MASPAPILCFGEALWDVLPQGLFPGGAPLNVAYHLRQLGGRPFPVSAVGDDFLGGEILGRLRAWGIAAAGVALDPARPTGTVRAAVGKRGFPTYRIARGAAWEHIPAPLLPSRFHAAAIVHGTLALRSPGNRRVLRHLGSALPRAFRVCDVNLRRPLPAGPVLREALRGADLLKVNQEELGLLTDGPASSRKAWERQARLLAGRTGSPRVCVTAGARGAGLLWEGEWRWEAARPVAVRDTIGAGDAFLAALLHGWLGRGWAPEECLAAACRLGEYVAGRDGATPPHPGASRG